jgi:hypothetical protein
MTGMEIGIEIEFTLGEEGMGEGVAEGGREGEGEGEVVS